MSLSFGFLKKYFWHIVFTLVPTITFIAFYLSNSTPIARFINDGLPQVSNRVDTATFAYLRLLPESIQNIITTTAFAIRHNYIIENSIRPLILTNLTVVLAFTAASITNNLKGLYFAIKKNESLTIRTLFIFIPFLKNRSRENPWGLVYDSVSKKPIDPAVVTIITRENGVGEFKQTKITDINGRFSFLVSPGKYSVTAEKTNYRFPSQIVTSQTDGDLQNVYHGEIIEINNPYVINLNIPMDPLAFDWNQSIKEPYNVTANFLKDQGRKTLLISGVTTAIICEIFLPTALNALIFISYLFNLLFVKVQIQKKLWGTVYYKETKMPVQRATISAISLPVNIALAHTLTDHLGRYHLLLSHGKYDIQVEMDGLDKKPKVLTKIPNVEVTKKDEIINFDIGI